MTRLAPLGWAELLARHGVDLMAPALAQELARELPGLDRTVPGFEDFSLDGNRAIEPGRPGESLLLHALSSPYVHPTTDGSPSANGAAYPTLEELDIIENYVFATARRRLADFPNAVVVVFAYQYRPGTRSPHRVHADVAYSRTGIARVGTAPAHYRAERRSFWVRPAADASAGIAVMPARYAAFLAQARTPSDKDEVATTQAGDGNRVFLFPLHKLFEGTECLVGSDIRLQFQELHRNDKLQRVHTHGQIQLVPGFDVNEPPFVRDSRNTRFVDLERTGASVLVVPVAHPELSRPAVQRNANTGKDEYVRFTVPSETSVNRFSSSLEIPASGDARRAPEYVNIRHRVDSATPGSPLDDLNTLPPAEFKSRLAAGGYEAAHFVDDCAEGALAVEVQGLFHTAVASNAAYSLVAAPDYFPLADQLDIAEWARRVVPTLRDHFAQGRPEPLSFGRRAVNPFLDLPPPRLGRAFESRDVTLTAIVGAAPLSRTHQPRARSNVLTTYLPDSASNEFAPGWDVSIDRDERGEFYATYGLGSPFPEDAKLCAALNSYWPAVAPDAARTFGLLNSPTALPLLDSELGIHPDADSAPGHRGWDGEYGPFLQTVGGERFVNHASLDRSDYVRNTLKGLGAPALLADVDSDELIRRMEALRRCIRTLPPLGDLVATTQLLLVSLTQVRDWAAVADVSDPRLTGAGYRFVFAELSGPVVPTNELTRVRRKVETTYECHLGQGPMRWRRNEEAFTFIPAP
ncbi:MAG TPA: hypothetical protein VK447_03895 [Myxococcaceae bacterium]|nr:hypothetical protein [Myxococcaceae bacterium]